MNLITPAFGLLFWMVLIFAIVFFILAKVGFPIITGAVSKRNEHIRQSLQDAKKAQQMLAEMDTRYEQMLGKVREEQEQMLAQARKSASQIIEDAKLEAAAEARRMVEQAREDIEIQKHDAVNDVRSVVASLAISISEKILRQKLSSDSEQMAFIEKCLQESQNDLKEGKLS